jgi:hypothetical protein
MKVTTGTCYFPSFLSACNYFKPYGFDSHGVSRKIRLKEIFIGKPEIKDGQVLKLLDFRWHICE